MAKKIPSFQELGVNRILLDTDNPRIAMWLEMREGEITSEDIELALGAGAGRSE